MTVVAHPLLEVRDLSVMIDGHTLVRGVNLSVDAG